MARQQGQMGASVGVHVKRRREQRGLSAAELARRAGISKAALSSIEAGRGNPTIDTLAAVAFGLQLPLTDLISPDDGPGGVVFRSGTRWTGVEVSRELMQRISVGHSVEVWHLRIPAHTDLPGIAHAAGTIEHLILTQGHLIAGPSDELVELVSDGDVLAFPGDRPHLYRTGSVPAQVTVLLSHAAAGLMPRSATPAG